MRVESFWTPNKRSPFDVHRRHISLNRQTNAKFPPQHSVIQHVLGPNPTLQSIRNRTSHAASEPQSIERRNQPANVFAERSSDVSYF